MRSSSRGLDRVAVTFDEPSLVANAGLVLVATLAARLGVARLVDAVVHLDGRVGGAAPGRKVLTLVHAMIAGASHIDHADVLRAGSTAKVLGHRVMAPSTLGTFLRSFTFGHVRQLDRVLGELLRRAWTFGAGPGTETLVMDVDSTICDVAGKDKAGAAYGYTRRLGYHPILATRADTGEVLHVRMRKGSANTQRGTRRFVEELVARVRRAGAGGLLVMRFDSGFWSTETIELLERLGVGYTMGVRMTKGVAAAVDAIDDHAWKTLKNYPEPGVAQVAETTYDGRRLIVRRVRAEGHQQQLIATWRHHGFLTDLAGDIETVDAFHRNHATVELAIKDLKDHALAHVPSGHFAANSAWLVCAAVAHNLVRWTAHLGHVVDAGHLTVTRTIRRQLFAVPGRLVNRSGHLTLRTPARWPWADTFTAALKAIRALPPAPT